MDFTIPHMWAAMGFIAKAVVIILGIMSVYVVAVSVERLIVFVKAKQQSRTYAMLIQDLLKQKKYREAADAALQFKNSHIARVIRSGLLEYIKGHMLEQAEAGGPAGTSGYDVLGAVNRAIEKSGAREMAGMRRGLAGLATVGSTAPFVGLFGTVFGIINSFQGMAAEGGGGLGAVAGGIAEALITTGAVQLLHQPGGFPAGGYERIGHRNPGHPGQTARGGAVRQGVRHREVAPCR